MRSFLSITDLSGKTGFFTQPLLLALLTLSAVALLAPHIYGWVRHCRTPAGLPAEEPTKDLTDLEAGGP